MNFIKYRRSTASMKRFYNWFSKHYGSIEKTLGITEAKILLRLFKENNEIKDQDAIDYACGSGLLTINLSDYFKSVQGRDLSLGMLRRAGERALHGGKEIIFKEGNLLEITEGPDSFDYVFIAFAMHLFSESSIKKILKKMISVAREKVIVIDHGRKWDFKLAVMEWIEGSYYDKFIKLDICRMAQEAGAGNCEEKTMLDCSIFIIEK